MRNKQNEIAPFSNNVCNHSELDLFLQSRMIPPIREIFERIRGINNLKRIQIKSKNLD